jgi:pimeloyl-ACP methyl ester carboxylesterase
MMDGEGGYFRVQSTRPHTLGFALEDSPTGICAWIIEKFRAWSDCDGDVESSYSKDQLLDNVMLYWLTGTATSSVRFYYEFAQGLARGALTLGARVEAPTGYARYPKEILVTSRRWAERQYNLVHFVDMPRGGHFAAMEQPQLFVDDVRACFRARR